MDELLVVSFSRESSRELRARVRDRLVARPGPGAGRPSARDRLDRALADFDGATVTTTHAFCHAMLRELGTAADHDRDAVLVEDPSDLVTEVADDLYVRKWGHPGAVARHHDARPTSARSPAPSPSTPATPLVPAPDRDGRRRRAAADARRRGRPRRGRPAQAARPGHRLRRHGASVWTPRSPTPTPPTSPPPGCGPASASCSSTSSRTPTRCSGASSARRSTATPPSSSSATPSRPSTASAAPTSAPTSTPATTRPRWPPCRRTTAATPGLLDGLAALLGGAALGDEEIRVLPVEAEHRGRMLDAGAPVELRVVPREGHGSTAPDLVSAKDARATVREDCARQVVALLSGGALLRDRGTEAGAERHERPLHPGDVAVIVRTNPEAVAVQERLRAAGVPAVVSGRTSVFTTPAAEEWQWLLEALEQPHRTARVRRLALGPARRPRRRRPRRGRPASTTSPCSCAAWGRVLTDRGVAALFEAVSADLRLQEPLLSQPDGERLLTDLRHVAEVLHEAALDDDLGLTALASWLHRRRDRADRRDRAQPPAGDRRRRRAGAHLAHEQGPGVPRRPGPVAVEPLVATPDATPASTTRPASAPATSAGPAGPGSTSTRAPSSRRRPTRSSASPTSPSPGRRPRSSRGGRRRPTRRPRPLHRLLLHDDATTVAPLTLPVPSDTAALTAFRRPGRPQRRHPRGRGGPVGDAVPVGRWDAPPRRPAGLRLARFDRGLDLPWRRTSYSALTQAAHEATYGAGGPGGTAGRSAAGAAADPPPVTAVAAFGSEPETSQKDDEADVTDADVARRPAPGDPDAALHEVPSLWHDLAGGTGFGTLVHRVLERYDPAVHGPDGPSSLGRPGRQPHPRRQADDPALYPRARHRAGHPARPARRRPALRRRPPARPAAGARLRAPPGRRRLPGGRHRRRSAGSSTLWRHHVPDGLLAGYADALAHLAEAPAARLPQRVGRRRGPGRPVRAPSATSSSTTRPTAWPRARSRSPPGTTATTRSSGPWSTRTTRCRRCCTPSPCTGTCAGAARGTTRPTHLGGVLYLYLRGMSGPGVRRRRRPRPRRVLVAPARRPRRRVLRPAGGRAHERALPRARPAGDRPARRAQRRGVLSAADVHVAPAPRRPGRRRRTSGSCSRPPSRSARPAAGPSSSTSPPWPSRSSPTPTRSRRSGAGPSPCDLPWPEVDGLGGRLRGQPA